MDGLMLKIIQNNRAAIELARTCISTPVLINTDIRQGPLYAIPLEVEANQKTGSAQVSESLVISSDAKKNISDNVAPGSKSWNLSGYITGIKALEPSNLFQPFQKINTSILWQWFERGAILTYKDGDAQIYNHVVIKDLKTSQQKDSANATPFSITLKEINVMETSLLNIAEDAVATVGKLKKSMINIGSALGLAVSMGTVTSTAADEAEDQSA